MVYIRGNPADFDSWERDGASGWSYREMSPYFIKGESNERGEDHFHGRWAEALGKSGLELSALGFGCMGLSFGSLSISEASAVRRMRISLEYVIQSHRTARYESNVETMNRLC